MYERPQLNVGRVGGCPYVDSPLPHVMFDALPPTPALTSPHSWQWPPEQVDLG